MCGRFVSATTTDDLLRFFGAVRSGRLDSDVAEAVLVGPRAYNIAPTTAVRIVLAGEARRTIDVARWGLEPWPSMKRAGYANARAETLADLPSFRSAYRHHRCLVPTDGFYEWTGPKGHRQPFFISRRDGAPLVLAGIWCPPTSRSEDGLPTCAIVTCAANADVSSVHDRMPVIVEPAAWDTWLDPRPAGDEQEVLLRVPPIDVLTLRPVRPEVGNVRSTGAELLDRYSPPAEGRSLASG